MLASLHNHRPRHPRHGFTLIEILIVVVIIGILAGITIPQFTSATTEARETMLRDEVRFMRNQLVIYRAQHRDTPAGYPGGDRLAAPDAATFVGHMTQHTDSIGNYNATGSATFRYPPYLTKIPENPITKKDGVWVVTGAGFPAPDESQPYGWIYNAELSKIIPNLAGTDLRNIPFTQY
jgi:prepilin-type N-terminal cleavage/methylation domain-containing protein